MSDLCRACSRHMFTCDIGSCKKCGEMTTSGMLTLCSKCSIALDQCGSCGRSILNEPEDDPNAPRAHIVSLQDDGEDISVQKGYTRQQVLEHSGAQVKVASQALRKWLDEHNLAHVTIDNELKAVRVIFITCSLNEAKLIEKAPGVAAISRGD